jgi:hypothetical protein
VVQHFDLFSGQQQLITRHSSGVAALRTHKEQQRMQQLPGLDSEDWLILVGCIDGQVCMGCSRPLSLTSTASVHKTQV